MGKATESKESYSDKEKNMFKQASALSLIAMPAISPMFVESLQAKSETEKSSQLAETVKAKVKDLGVGSDVTVMRKKPVESVKGQVESIEEEAFVLKLKGGTTQRIAYDTVQWVDPTRLSYRQGAQPDPAEVRRVAVGLGVDKDAKLTLADGRKLQCRLQAVGKDDFTIKDTKTESVSQVAYRDVTQLERKGLSKGKKIAIIAGVAGGVLLAASIIVAKIAGY